MRPVVEYHSVGSCGALFEAGLGITVHAGELTGWRTVEAALDHLRPARIGHGVRAIENADLVRRIADEGISAAELARVKTQAIATQVYKRDSLMGQAMEIGYLESAGLSWRDEQRLLEGLRAVTAEEVQAVAKRHFDDTSLNTARLDPQPLAEKRPRSPFAAPRH